MSEVQKRVFRISNPGTQSYWHGLNSKDVMVAVVDGLGETVFAHVVRVDANRVAVTPGYFNSQFSEFQQIDVTNSGRVVVIG